MDYLVERQLCREDAEGALKRNGRAETDDVLVGIEEEEVADLAEVDVDPELLLEAAELTSERSAMRTLSSSANWAGCRPQLLARRAAPERLALTEDDVGDAELRQVVAVLVPIALRPR